LVQAGQAVQGAAASGQDAIAFGRVAALGLDVSRVAQGFSAEGHARQVSGLIGLLRQHQGADEKRLQQTLDNAPEALKNVVGQTVQRLVKARNAAKARLREHGRRQADFECVLSLLGRVPAARDELTQDQRSRVDTECAGGARADGGITVRVSLNMEPIPRTGNASLNTGPIPRTGNASLNTEPIPVAGNISLNPDGSPLFEFHLPSDGANITQGQNILFRVNTTGGVQVKSVEISVNGVVVETITNLAEFTGLEIPVPGGIASLTVQASANVSGRETTFDSLNIRVLDSLSIEVKEGPPPTIRIIGQSDRARVLAPSDRGRIVAPADRARILGPSDRVAWKVEEGENFPIVIQAEDNGQVHSVELIINGEAHSATLSDGNWVYQATAPQGPPLSDKKSTTAPPQIFVGAVSIGGTAAPDGTVVTAWISPAPDSTLKVEVKATDDQGGTAIAYQEIQVVSRLVQVSEATVTDGGYTLLVHLRVGHVFSGQVVSFRVGGTLVPQTAKWQQGGADELNLFIGQSD